MACTPSARLEELIPNHDTAYTREGTIAHAMGEHMLKWYLGQPRPFALDADVLGRRLRGKNGQGSPVPDDLMMRCAAEGPHPVDMALTVHEGYVRLVLEDYAAALLDDPDAVLLVEQRLKLDEYIPEGFGSSDAVLIAGDALHVYDLKFGKGVKVEAEENPQMMCYALGALLGPGELYDIRRVFMTIMQPRLSHVSTWETTAAELLGWAERKLRPAAELAFRGEGERVTGDHCRFCRAAAQCSALRATCETAAPGPAPGLMGEEELADALRVLPVIKAYISALEDWTLARALEGTVYPGWKLVEGRSVRQIADQKAAMAALAAAGFDEGLYVRPKELKTIGDLEKLLRRKGFQELLGGLVTRSQGRPALVPDDDPRPPFSSAENDFKDINL